MNDRYNKTVPVSVFKGAYSPTKSVTEMTLTYNQPKAQMIVNKLNWNGVIYNSTSFINNDYLNNSKFW